MLPMQFLFFCLFFFSTYNKIFVSNLKKQRECVCIGLVEHSYINSNTPYSNRFKPCLHFSFLKIAPRKLRNRKQKRVYYERNGINVPKDICMFGKTNVYYIRENIYDKTKNNLKENEFDSFNDEELGEIDNVFTMNGEEYLAKDVDKMIQVSEKERETEEEKEKEKEIARVQGQGQGQGQGQILKYGQDYNKNLIDSEKENKDSIFSYLNKPTDYVVQEGNSPKVSIYERVYNADAQTLQRFFENANEINLQLLKNIKNISEKEKLINKKVIEKVKEDIKNFQETNEIMDVKGNILKPNITDTKSKSGIKKKNVASSTSESVDTSDMDEEEKNELLKKLYIIDKKTNKYVEENIYFVIQTWVPDLKIDDTLIIIDNIEKGYNDYDISTYYEKFKKAKHNNFYYDFEYYHIKNIPSNINDDTEIECEHINSYNNTYNKLNNYNIKKYTYTYTTNENVDTKFTKNEPLPPIVIINTKKNSMVQEWEGKNFKNRLKKNKSHEYTRIQRAFRPFSYIDLSDITCIYKYNYLQIKMKLSHRKYKNEIYPFFVPINNNCSENLINFYGYKQNGDNAWSFFWHNFDYDKDTDYRFLNTSLKLNITENKFEEINKKKSKKIMRHILKERKGK